MGPPGAARSDGPSVPVANFTDGRRLTIGTREWPSKCQADEAHFPRRRQARDHAGARCLAQERRRWPRALNAPPSAAAPPSDLAESPPRESTTGPAAASVAPTVADSSSAPPRPSPASSSLHRTTRMTPGEMHVRTAEANLANAMLRLVSLTPATDRSATDIGDVTNALASTEEARPAVDGFNAAAPTVSRPPAPHRTWVRPPDWMPHKADWPGYSEPTPLPIWPTLRKPSATYDAPADSADPSVVTPSPAANSNASRDSPVLSVDTAQLSEAAPPLSPSQSPSPGSSDSDVLRQYVNAKRQRTSPIVLSLVSPDDADTELVRLLSSILGVPCSISRRGDTLPPGFSSTSSTRSSSTDPSSLAGSR